MLPAMQAKGTFEISMNAEPPYSSEDGILLGRTSFDKRFSGALEATSTVHMLAARTQVPGSAGYVAIERVVGTLAGKRGSFVLQHNGSMNRGEKSLSVQVVPDSATGELSGLAGHMSIDIVQGQHLYTFEFDFRAPQA
jgi:hypothetical protein